MRNKSARQRGKKKNYYFTISKFRAKRYEDICQARVGKPGIEKGGEHADMVSEGFGNF